MPKQHGKKYRESASAIETARAAASKLVDDARFEARRSADDERVRAESEVQALIAKREFLLADVEHLEQFASSQRDRLRDAAAAIADVADGPSFTDLRRPLLSAAAEDVPSGPLPAPSVDEVAIPDDVPAPIAASPAPSLPVVDVPDVWQHQGDEPPESATTGARDDESFVDELDHDDTPAAATSPNGGMYRIAGDDVQ